MAGFFGFFDYSKPGKGVRKDEPQKGRFAHFWELFFRKFWKLIQLNLLYLLFCVPIVTIGPATAAHTYVLRNFATEQPVFLFSDFWDAFKSNWKQSFVFTLLLTVFSYILMVAGSFYFGQARSTGNLIYYLPAGLCIFMGFMAVNCCFYVYLMIVTLELPLKGIIKNGLILTVLCIKTNLITLLVVGLLLLLAFLFFPLSIFVMFFLGFSLIGFVICYNSYPGIKKYAIDPYVQKIMEENGIQEEEATETVFSDEQLLPGDKDEKR